MAGIACNMQNQEKPGRTRAEHQGSQNAITALYSAERIVQRVGCVLGDVVLNSMLGIIVSPP